MKILRSLLAGLTGAIALNIVHEIVRRIDRDAPQVQLIGEEAITKSMKKIGTQPPKGLKLYLVTLAGDVISNALYYSLIGVGNKKSSLFRGAAQGAIAGLGALGLTKPMGLDDTPVNKTNKTKAMTIGWYTLGGLVTTLVLKQLSKKA